LRCRNNRRKKDSLFNGKYNRTTLRIIFIGVAVKTRTVFFVAGLRKGVQQRIGAHEAQTDAQRREEVRVHDVRQSIQAAGPLVSTN